MRYGTNVEGDIGLWNSRKIANLSTAEKLIFDLSNNETVEGTCFNKDRDKTNRDYIRLFRNVNIMKSINIGTHATTDNHKLQGMVKNMPRIGYYNVGMMIKLSANICTGLGLVNNSRRVIIYRGDHDSFIGQPNLPLQDIILMCEFPGYKGIQVNQLMELRGQKNWIPIVVRQNFCDSKTKCCNRTMFPICVAKADSIYCLQGLTAGDSHMIKNVKVTWTSAAEGKMPNSLYVGATRAEKISNLAFTNAISIDDLSKIGKYPSVLRQRQELQTLTDIAMHLRQNIDATVNTYVTEIQWLINYIRAHVLPTVHNNQHASNLITACINQWQTSLDSIEI
jgi:hypothetical protein